MRFLTFLAVTGLAIVTSAKPTTKKEPEALVEVKLTPKSGSVVKVSVKNVGKKQLDFFQRGNLLDENPVHKLRVQSSSGQLVIKVQSYRKYLLTLQEVEYPHSSACTQGFDRMALSKKSRLGL
jgi:hypothetical protein